MRSIRFHPPITLSDFVFEIVSKGQHERKMEKILVINPFALSDYESSSNCIERVNGKIFTHALSRNPYLTEKSFFLMRFVYRLGVKKGR